MKNGDEAIEFYKNGFGAEERCPMKGPDGRVAHAELKLGDCLYVVR